MAKRASGKQSKAVDLSEAAKKLSADPEKAGRTLPKEERDAFRESQKSVVDARRSAETKEGLLRIN